ncbi:MAG: MBL fold metallo-hydrolase [Pseudomonadota bacterium]
MRINRKGKISEDFYVIGNPDAPVYLLDGSTPVLFDAGYTALAYLYEQDIKNVLGERTPAYLFITHAHFDHIGAAAYFKSLWPEMKIVGSAKSVEILARPNAVRLISTLNREAGQLLLLGGLDSIHYGPFQCFDIDMIPTAGETIELSSHCNVQALHTPGHTWDFMSYWVPEKKILVASEAVGCDDGTGYIVTEFLVDYDEYRRSLEALSRLDFEILCPGHRLVLTGEDAEGHVDRSLQYAARYVAKVETILLEEAGDMDRTVARIKAMEWDPLPSPKQPEQPYLLNTRARVKTIWERMQRKN